MVENNARPSREFTPDGGLPVFDETIRSHDKQYRRNTLENPGRAASLAAFKPAVEDRRAFAKIIAAPFEREKTVDPRARQLSCRRRSRPSIAPLTTKRVVKGPSKLAN